jgi:threonine/homoserine/homoserine lactone efflux protein
MITPGPSHLLMLSNSMSNGFRKSTATAFGDLSANFLQMLAASFGLASILLQFQDFFTVIKWLGVAYLLFLGIRLLLSKGAKIGEGKRSSSKALFWQGFITSAANPKAVIFFAALFPQFINPAAPLLMQFICLSLTYIVIDGTFLLFYGKFAQIIKSRIQHGFIGNYINQLSGSVFISAAIMLGLKDLNSVVDE